MPLDTCFDDEEDDNNDDDDGDYPRIIPRSFPLMPRHGPILPLCLSISLSLCPSQNPLAPIQCLQVYVSGVYHVVPEGFHVLPDDIPLIHMHT